MIINVNKTAPLPRYSRRPFPEYRFVPGATPHPIRDPDGHSYGLDSDDPEYFDPQHWYECESYLYGVDLYNHGYWWEAHEAWEACWMAAGKRTRTGLFLQGLIQITAGCLKKYQGHGKAGRGLVFEGLEKFPPQRESCLGIELAPFRQELEDYFSGRRDEQPIIELLFPDPDRDTGK